MWCSCVYWTIWQLLGSVSRAAALRLSKAQMKVSGALAHFAFFLFASHSVSSSLCVSVSLSLYLLLSIHLVSCAREILTDPLEELRDSISRQQNSTVVLGNSVALER